MRKRLLPGRAFLAGTLVLLSALTCALFTPPQPSQALPVYSRRYQVPCEACHTVPPALNATGLAFQANHFNWPGGPPRSRALLAQIPISGLATWDSFDNLTGQQTTSGFQTLQLFATDGFPLGRAGNGGYFVDDFVYVNGGTAGAFGNAFVSLPVAGPGGALSLTAGQFTPLMYQYDPLNSLTVSLPATIENSVGAFSFGDVHPGVRLDYFSNRGQESADGDYLDIGVPFQGLLTANDQSDVEAPQGAYLHAFRRTGGGSVGVFGFDNAGHYIAGAMGTYRWHNQVYLLATGQVSHDQFGHEQIASGEADYIVSSQLALTGRLETMNGEQSATFPVFGVTYYPFRPQVIRLAAETTQERANRSLTFSVFGQF